MGCWTRGRPTLAGGPGALARPADATDAHSGSQRTADARTELARRSRDRGRLPQSAGTRPQLTVTVDLDACLATRHPGQHPTAEDRPLTRDPSGTDGLGGRLRAAMALLPPALGAARPAAGGRADQPGRPARPTHGPGRPRRRLGPPRQPPPLAWGEAHHLRHWLHGGPTDLANLALLCRTHHRAVHDGGWQLTRHPDGRLTATPPRRRHRAAA
jgi:hypothetical protein